MNDIRADSASSHTVPRTVIIVLLLLNFSLRLTVALFPLSHIDEVTLPDDTYLSLTVARNIANGLGATYGGEFTSGIQPMYVYLMAPVYMISDDQYDLPVHAALILLSLFDTLALLLLVRLIAQFSSSSLTPILAALAWIINPLTIKMAVNGLETAIAGFFILLILTLYKKYFLDISERPPKHLLLFGAVCGLGIFARIDTVMLVGVLGLMIIWNNRSAWKLSMMQLSIVGAGIALTYGPWLLYSYISSGDLYPVSGKAVRFLGIERASMTSSYLVWLLRTTMIGTVSVIDNNKMLLLVGGTLMFPAFYLSSSFYRRLRASMPAVSAAYLIAGALAQLHVIFILAFWFVERTIHPVAVISAFLSTAFYLPLVIHGPVLTKQLKHSAGLILPFLIFSAILFSAYTHYIFGIWYYDRYLHPLNILFVMFFAVILELLLPLFRTDRIRRIAAGVIAVTIVVLNVTNRDFTTLYFDTGANTYGYRSLGIWARDAIPDGTTVGSCQTGSLGYFADNLTVVNLDGVVNRESHEALVTNEIVPYIKAKKISYVIDWELNFAFLNRVSNEPAGESIVFEKTIDGFTSWNHEWNLYSVKYGEPQ